MNTNNIALCAKRLKMGVTRSQAQGFAINNFYDVLKIQSVLFISFGNKKYRSPVYSFSLSKGCLLMHTEYVHSKTKDACPIKVTTYLLGRI